MARRNKRKNTKHRVNPENVKIDRILPKPAKQIEEEERRKKGSAGGTSQGDGGQPKPTPPERPGEKDKLVRELNLQILVCVDALRQVTEILGHPSTASLAEGGVPKEVRERLESYCIHVVHPDLIRLVDSLLAARGVPPSGSGGSSDPSGGGDDEPTDESPRPIEVAEGEDKAPEGDDTFEETPPGASVTPLPGASAPAGAPSQAPFNSAGGMAQAPASDVIPTVIPTPLDAGSQRAANPVTLPSNWPNPG